MQMFTNMTADVFVISQTSIPLFHHLKKTRRIFIALISCLDIESRHIPRQLTLHSDAGRRC